MDQSSIERMLADVEPLVVSITKRKLRGWPVTLIDDIRQEVRIGLWQKALPRFDPSRGELSAFAGTAIRNLLYDIVRDLQRNHHFQVTDIELQELVDDSRADHPIDENLQVIHDTLPDLSPTDADIIGRIISREPSPEADKSAKPNTIHMRKHRAMNRLRDILGVRPDKPAA
jgi:RNA polymerase sigma factor (sigma-70 family)